MFFARLAYLMALVARRAKGVCVKDPVRSRAPNDFFPLFSEHIDNLRARRVGILVDARKTWDPVCHRHTAAYHGCAAREALP